MSLVVELRDSLVSQLAAAQQQAGLGQLGSSLAQQQAITQQEAIAQLRMMRERGVSPPLNYDTDTYVDYETGKKTYKPKTYRDELQKEVDEWLDD